MRRARRARPTDAGRSVIGPYQWDACERALPAWCGGPRTTLPVFRTMTPRRGMRLAGCVYNTKTAALKSSAAVYKLQALQIVLWRTHARHFSLLGCHASFHFQFYDLRLILLLAVQHSEHLVVNHAVLGIAPTVSSNSEIVNKLKRGDIP